MRSKRSVICLFIFLAVLIPGPSSWNTVSAQVPQSTTTSSNARPNPGMSKSGWSHELIQRKLDEMCDFNFDERPWNEVEEELESTLKFNIVLHTSASDDSLGEDEPITCNLAGINYRNALRLVLEKYNATFIVRNGVINIISQDDMEDPRFMTNCSFSVEQLLAGISRKETGRIGKPRVVQHSVKTPVELDSVMEAEVKKQPTDQSSPTHASVELNTAESLLVDLVTSTFRPQRWKASGQGEATFNIIGRQAVVFSDNELADDLRDFLKDLEYQISRN